MSKNLIAVIASVAAVAVCAAAWFLLPGLQDPQRSVDVQAAVHVERARRLLYEYNAALGYESIVAGQLEELGIEADADDIADALADEYQQVHSEMWEDYRPNDQVGGRLSPARANYGNVSTQIRKGLDAHDLYVDQNDQLLEDALAAVGRALSVTVGDASSRSYAEAIRLKGVILYHKGMARRIEALLRRREGDPYRRELMALAILAQEAQAAKTFVADSEIEERIAELKVKVAELKAIIQADREALTSLDGTIGDLDARFAEAKSRRGEARTAMERLRAEGLDFSDPNAADSFRSRYLELDRAYRKAARETHELEHGTYPTARIDLSGDFLTGRYVEEDPSSEPAITFGLASYLRERTALAARFEGNESALADVRAGVERLVGMRRSYEAHQAQALASIKESESAAIEVFEELSRIDSEAFVVEDEALDLLDQAAGAFESASRNADQWIQKAALRVQALSPEAKNRSAFQPRTTSRWMGGNMVAQVADARLAEAWVHYDRFDTYGQNADILAVVTKTLELTEADVDAERIKATEAHDAGVAVVEEAMAVLETAHRKADGHWTITAQAAGTTYMLALFGHEDYTADAIEAYRSAVRGREDRSFAEPFVKRLARLENR